MRNELFLSGARLNKFCELAPCTVYILEEEQVSKLDETEVDEVLDDHLYNIYVNLAYV